MEKLNCFICGTDIKMITKNNVCAGKCKKCKTEWGIVDNKIIRIYRGTKKFTAEEIQVPFDIYNKTKGKQRSKAKSIAFGYLYGVNKNDK